MKSKIEGLITRSLEEVSIFLGRQDTDSILKGNLYGPGGSLDSSSLVTLVVLIEQHVSDLFSLKITMASDKAMSPRNSPFLTYETLVEYTYHLVLETKQCQSQP